MVQQQRSPAVGITGAPKPMVTALLAGLIRCKRCGPQAHNSGTPA